jgi:hypothetical protein
MGFVLVLRELSRQRLLLAIGVLIAAVAATFSVYRFDGGSFKARSLQYSSANTQVLVDSPSSALGNISQQFEPLSARAAIYANFMASPVVLNLIGQQVGLSGEQIYAAGPVSAAQPRVVQEPTALKRNVEITGETNPYRLNFESQANLPTINIYSQAPTTSQAVALANAAAVGLQRYVAQLESTSGVPPRSRVTIRQLGFANGAVVDGGISKALMAMVFVAVFVLWCLLMIVVARFRADWRASAVFESVTMRPTADADALAIEEDRPRIAGPIRLEHRQHGDDRPESSTDEHPASASLTQTVG